jgi:aquaporin Z
MSLGKRAVAEFFGAFWLVFGGCGAAVLAAGFPRVGIGFLGVALALGLTVLTMAFAIGHISGWHLNPAISAGLVVGKRFPVSDLLPYVVAQVMGAIAAAGVLYLIASGQANFDVNNGFASNGYGVHSPGGYSLLAGFVAEVVLTAFFLIVIMGATDSRASQGFAPIAIGLCLTLIHLVCIPVTNTSVNPARSPGPALFVGGWPCNNYGCSGWRHSSVERSAAGFTGPCSASLERLKRQAPPAFLRGEFFSSRA